MRLKGLLEPPRFETEDENRAALILQVVLVTAVIIVLALGIIVPFWSGARASVAGRYGVVLTIVSTSLLLFRWRHLRLAAVFLCTSLWLFCLAVVWFVGGASSPYLLAFVPLVVMTGIVWSERAAIAMTLSTVAAALGMVGAEATALLPAPSPVEPIRVWASLTGALLMTVTLMIIGLRSLGSAIRDAKQSEGRLTELIEEAPDGIVVLSPSGRILTYNRAAESVSGYTADEIVGRRFTDLDLMPATQARELAGVFFGLISGRAGSQRELEIRHKNGRTVPIEANTALLRRGGGDLALQVTIRDISERRASERKHRELEEQLRQAQKMEAVGQLAGGVAHDFNNLITAINGYSELALMQLPAENPLRADLQEIRKAGDRAASLTRQLLAFSRRQVLEPELIELNAVVRDVEKMLLRLIGEDLELTTTLAPDLGRVLIDPGQLEQVIVNLAVNARDAMPTGGSLDLTTAEISLEEGRRIGRTQLPAGRYVLLRVADTGEGMDEAVQEHLFEPFFTTKPKDAGTGLGLATVYGIVKQSGSYITLDSRVGRGSEFTIYLPRVEAAPPAPDGQPTPSTDRGSGVILLVEDEDPVREVVRRTLEGAGYQLLTAADATEAQTVADGFPGEIQLLLTDVVLPGVRGDELAETLTASSRVDRVLFMSGYAEEAVSRHGIREQGDLLVKPFTSEALVLKVQESLAGYRK